MIGLGCHSRNFGSGTPEEIFSFIKKLEYEYIDVDSVGTIKQTVVLENPVAAAQYTRELSEEYQLKLAEYFLGNILVDGQSVSPSASNIQHRDQLYRNFAKICEFAVKAGFLSIMGSAGSIQTEIGFERSFENARTVLTKMVEIAAGYGVSFHVEPSQRSLLNSPAKALTMINQVAGLKYTLDFLHFQVNGYDQKDAMQLLEYTGHLHARQAAVGWPKCPFEHGEIDYDLIVKRLRGLNWNGVIAMEFWNGPAEVAAGMSPIEQTILMRYQLKGLIKKYFL